MGDGFVPGPFGRSFLVEVSYHAASRNLLWERREENEQLGISVRFGFDQLLRWPPREDRGHEAKGPELGRGPARHPDGC